MTSAAYTPPVTRATFRRTVLMATSVGAVVAGALVIAGYGDFALFGLVGLALGALNLGLVVRTVARFAVDKPSKAAFSGSVLVRLAVITGLAFACALLFRPPGLAVFGGLALFQFLALVSSMIPLIKEIRRK